VVHHIDPDRGDARLGGIGYLVDRLAGLHQVFLPIGIILGGAGGVYIVYLRYGRGNGGER
jgi:F0F1-type ATP synthase assembly protein I